MISSLMLHSAIQSQVRADVQRSVGQQGERPIKLA
jgi:hypothetical protein